MLYLWLVTRQSTLWMFRNLIRYVELLSKLQIFGTNVKFVNLVEFDRCASNLWLLTKPSTLSFVEFDRCTSLWTLKNFTNKYVKFLIFDKFVNFVSFVEFDKHVNFDQHKCQIFEFLKDVKFVPFWQLSVEFFWEKNVNFMNFGTNVKFVNFNKKCQQCEIS